jgi:hypothetical protein
MFAASGKFMIRTCRLYCLRVVVDVQEPGNQADYRMLSRLRAHGRQHRSELLSRRAGLRRHRAHLRLYVPHLQEWMMWFADLVAELQDC